MKKHYYFVKGIISFRISNSNKESKEEEGVFEIEQSSDENDEQFFPLVLRKLMEKILAQFMENEEKFHHKNEIRVSDISFMTISRLN